MSSEDGNFSCECSSGYRGERCERSMNSTLPMTSISTNESATVVTPLTKLSKTELKPLLSERNATTISTSTQTTITSTMLLQQDDINDDGGVGRLSSAGAAATTTEETTKLTQNTDDNENRT